VGTSSFFVFAVLPFGLSTACYIFTKLMRPLIRYWRGRGIKAIVYLDNGIIAVRQWERAFRESACVKEDLTKASFVVNVEKSICEPSNRMEWLGTL